MREIGNIHTGGSIELEHIREFWMEQRFNEHAKAYIRAGIQDKGMLEQVDGDSSMYVYADTESGREILFYGSIQTVSVLHSCGAYSEVEIRLVSGTVRLDGAKKSRSFQNVGMTYEQVARQVIHKEPKSDIIWNLADTPKLNGPLIQYHETDWEFLKRLASHLKAKILADISSDRAWVYIGCPKRGTEHEIQCLSWKAGISEEFFSYTGRSQREFAYCTIESEENLEIGLEIRFAGRSMTIFRKRAYTQGNCLIYCYDAGGQAFFETEKLFNDDLTGRAITGKVLSTKNETIRMQMDIDTEQDEATAYDFQWCPETGNLMYCMPQVGTTVSLYFGDSEESSACAINNVRTNGESCPEMEDPENKTWTTEYDKRILMNRTGLGIYSDSSNQESSCFCMEDDIGIRFQSDNAFNILASGGISIDAQNVKVEALMSVSGLIPDLTGEQSSAALELETDINIYCENNVYCHMYCAFHYPNIMDAPRTYKKDHLIGKILVGIVTAVAVALIVAALATMGAAIIATAAAGTAAAAAIEAIGFGSILVGSLGAGALGGITAVLARGITEGSNDNVSDYGDYMKDGAINGGVTALLAAYVIPVSPLFEGHKYAKYAISVIDSEANYNLSMLLDPAKEADVKTALKKGVLGFFSPIIKDSVKGSVNEGLDSAVESHSVIKFLNDNDFIGDEVINIISKATTGVAIQLFRPEENRGYYEPDGMTNSEVSDEEIEKKKEEHEESL
ncbi:MAG: hypothetical protein J1F42_14400, partial [Lachnospiraceae bacterium]|nr:hypothetical protein [Lachnospiraceae bacterium]